MPTPRARVVLLVAQFHLSIDITFDIALSDRMAFVMLLLAFGDTDLDFDILVIKEDAQWDKGIPLATNHAPYFVELAAFEEQLTFACRLMVEVGARLAIRADVGIVQPGFAAFDAHVATTELTAPCANRFDFAPRQGNACGIALLDKVFMKGITIIGNRFARKRFPFRPHFLLHDLSL